MKRREPNTQHPGRQKPPLLLFQPYHKLVRLWRSGMRPRSRARNRRPELHAAVAVLPVPVGSVGPVLPPVVLDADGGSVGMATIGAFGGPGVLGGVIVVGSTGAASSCVTALSISVAVLTASCATVSPRRPVWMRAAAMVADMRRNTSGLVVIYGQESTTLAGTKPLRRHCDGRPFANLAPAIASRRNEAPAPALLFIVHSFFLMLMLSGIPGTAG
jgi:hypothetical protein